MRLFLIELITVLALTIPVYAQQDPDDPGMQDSLIIGSISVDSSATFAFIQAYVVSDDSVVYFDIPLTLRTEYGGVCFGSGTQYFPPINSWDDCFDTVGCDPPFSRRFCFYDLGGDPVPPPLFTDSLRIAISVYRLIILPNTPSQIVVIDSFSTCEFGTPTAGFVPAFVPGYLIIGMQDGINNDTFKPSSFSLSQNYPNPFNSSTEIQFSLPQSGRVSLVIFDIQGREIRRLFDGNLEAGNHNVIWNGLDNDSKSVSSGIYFYRLNSGNANQTNRMTLLR
jgi:hypothetical protein